MSLKVRKQANSGHDLAHQVTKSGSRLTTEMSSAIKRQEQISRADYWRTGFSGLGLINSPNGSHKRPGFQTLTRVNIDQVFPGLNMPSAISATHQKLRSRPRLAPTILFNRSRTTLVPSVQKVNHDGFSAITKPPVPELTCVQLRETLTSPDQSSFSGLLRFSPTNTRYSDMFSDEHHSSDEEKEIFNSREQNEKKTLKTNINKGKRRNSLPAIKYKTIEPYESKSKDELSPHISSPTTVVVTKVMNNNYAKPILKLSPNKRDIDLIDSVAQTNSSAIRRANTLSEIVSPWQQAKATQTTDPELCVYPSAIQSKMIPPRPREYTIPILHSRTDSRSDTRKRSVSFKPSHKVHEYVPHEPICS